MAKIYLVRHQSGGVLWQFPFAEAPSAEQQAVLADYCARLHGEVHPKTKEPYFLNVVEIDVLNNSAVPQALIPVGGSERDNTAAIGQNQVTAVGHVTNPKAGS